MNPPQSPPPTGPRERELFLLCSRTGLEGPNEARARLLLEGPLDWPAVVAHGHRHGTLPLLYHHLTGLNGFPGEGRPSGVPRDVLGQLRVLASASAARSLYLECELLQVLEDLESAGAPAVVWKGPVVAHRWYPAPQLRGFVDLDLMVRREDAPRARKALEDRGYAVRSGMAVPTEELFRRANQSVPMIRREARAMVDLHWGGASRYFSSAMDSDALWREAVTVPLGEGTVRALPDELHLLLLSLHGAKHGPFPWPKLKWVTDVDAFLRSRPDAEWEVLLDRVGEVGCRRMLLLAVALARALLGAPVPEVVARALEGEPEVRDLVPPVRERLLASNPPSFAFRDRVRFDLAVRERFRDRAGYRLHRLLTPSPRDLEDGSGASSVLRIPRRLTRLGKTYLLRPSRARNLLRGRDRPHL